MAATARTVYVTDARMSRTSLAAHQSDHRRRGEAVAEEVMRRAMRGRTGRAQERAMSRRGPEEMPPEQVDAVVCAVGRKIPSVNELLGAGWHRRAKHTRRHSGVRCSDSRSGPAALRCQAPSKALVCVGVVREGVLLRDAVESAEQPQPGSAIRHREMSSLSRGPSGVSHPEAGKKIPRACGEAREV